jgi:spore germination protein GerM
MRRLIVLALGLGLVAVACARSGAQGLGPAPGADRSSPPESPPAGPTQERQSNGFVTYEVWFAAEHESVGEGGQAVGGTGLFLTNRTQEATPAVGRAALTALLEGPTPEEAAVGVSSAIPSGTELVALTIEDGIATVDLSAEFGSGGGSTSVLTRLAQVVYSITQFPTVEAMVFEIEGERPEPYFSEVGVVLDGPQSREDWADHLPPILVESPLIGEVVDNPVTISGSANVFEATVSIRILDADGDEIARTFTTATCGTGCRGDYSKSVAYRVDSEQSGTVEVFESSPIDGSAINLVSIPVTLVP